MGRMTGKSTAKVPLLNRELGILAFNRRVLAQAEDESVPLLERLRFLTIVSSNLDEFFEIRVAGIKEQIKLGITDPGPDGLTPKETLAIVTGRRSGRLVLVWPLVVERGTGVVKLTSMGAPVSQYSDALIEPSIEAPQQLRDAWDKVVSAVKPDLVWLPRVRDDAAIAPLMKDIGALATQRMEAPYIDLRDTPDLDTYMGRRSPQARKKHIALLEGGAGSLYILFGRNQFPSMTLHVCQAEVIRTGHLNLLSNEIDNLL